MASQPTGKAGHPAFVAVDYGTRLSRIAHIRGEGAAFITDLAGDSRIPSVVAISPEGGLLAGAAARDRQTHIPDQAVLSAKRLLRSPVADLTARGDFFPHTLGPADDPMVQLHLGGRLRPAVELMALSLVFLRRSAEISMEKPVRAGVLPVPVSFSPFDRQALWLAAQMAGFEHVRLIDDPTAAALAWAANGGRGRIAACSWGAGFLSVAVIEVGDRHVRVLASAGSDSAGGDLIDDALANDFLAKVRAQAGLIQNEVHVARHILGLAEAAKHDLASRGKAELAISLGGAQPIRVAYTKEDLEGWLAPLKQEAHRLCQRVISEAEGVRGDLDGLVLAGGLTRIPSLATHMEEMFSYARLEVPDPEEAIVLGALERARLLERERPDQLVFDSLTESIGLEGQGGEMAPVLERAITLPASKHEVFTTFLERQTEVAVQLFMGAGEAWAPLARVEISEIPPMKPGEPALEINLTIDEDGILTASGKETTRGKPLNVELRPTLGLPSSMVAATLASLPGGAEEDFEGGLRAELRQRGSFIRGTIHELTRRHAGSLTRDEKQLITKKSLELDEVLEGADLMEIRACVQELEEAGRALIERDLAAGLKAFLR